jgi:arsenic resistance protein ArsH
MANLLLSNGDLNNISAARPVAEIAVDPAFALHSLAILESEDDHEIRQQYRPFMLPEEIANSDWVANLELSTVMKLAYEEMHRINGGRLRVLVLYGSLRQRCVPQLNFLLHDLIDR